MQLPASRILFFFFLIVAAAGLVQARPTAADERAIATTSGDAVIIARHAQWSADCKANGLPAISINQKPAAGTTNLSAGKHIVSSNSINPGQNQCASKELTGVRLTYQPKPNFVGTDKVSYTVVLNGTRKFSHTVTITVLPPLSDQPPNQAVASAPSDAPTTRTTDPVAEPLSPAVAVGAASPVVQTSSPGTRIALVIGNTAYRNVPALANPARDAGAVAAALRATGFKTVELKNDLTREALNDALHAFAAEADRADWAMVYYAGHGMEVNGNNYLIPVDAKLAIDRDAEFEAIPLDRVMSAVGGARKLRLVLLDACRDNPFAHRMKRSTATRSITRGLASVEPEAGTLVVFAAKAGQVALDGEGNSPFVTALTRRMMTPGLEIRRLFDHVRDDVLETTQRQQQPFSYGSLPGSEDYYFREVAATKR